MAEVGKNIKKIRKEKNLTQDELADRLHCTRQTISNYENGKSENRTKKKVAVLAAFLVALILQVVAAFLMPLAKEYGWKQFMLEPMYLLRYVLWPFAMTLLGWAAVETGRELAGIRIWDGKSEKTRKMVHTVFCVLEGCLVVAAVLTLWLGAEMAYQWYLSGKMMREQGSFESSAVPHLMPEQLFSGILYFDVLYLDKMGIFGGVWFFWGAALAFFRTDKRKSEKSGR